MISVVKPNSFTNKIMVREYFVIKQSMKKQLFLNIVYIKSIVIIEGEAQHLIHVYYSITC